MSAVDLIMGVPPVVWAAFAGASLTLLGVGLQNLLEFKRLRTQLAHDADERERERNHALRRVVYLESVESVAKAQRLLLAIANMEKPLQTLECDPLELAALTKVHLIGRIETIQAVDAISVSLVEQFVALCAVRLDAEVARRELDEANAALGVLNASREQLLHLIAAAGDRDQPVGFSTSTGDESGPPNRYVAEVLRAQSALEQAHARVTAASAALHDRSCALWLKSVQASTEYGAVVAKAAVPIRRELEQTDGFDNVLYEQHVAGASDRQVALMRAFVLRSMEQLQLAESPQPAPTGEGTAPS